MHFLPYRITCFNTYMKCLPRCFSIRLNEEDHIRVVSMEKGDDIQVKNLLVTSLETQNKRFLILCLILGCVLAIRPLVQWRAAGAEG